MRTDSHRTRALNVAAALLVFTAALLAVVQLADGLPGEVRLARWTHGPHVPEWLSHVCSPFQFLGTPVPAAVTITALVVITALRVGVSPALFLAVAGMAPVASWVLKTLIGPTDPWRQIWYDSAGNFPSGHVVYATALFGAAAIQHPRAARGLWLLVALMGPARILNGSHLVSDVLAGYAVGLAWLLVATTLLPDWAHPLERDAVRSAAQTRTTSTASPSKSESWV